MSRECDPDGVILDGTSDGNRTHGPAHLQHFALAEHAVDLRLFDLCRPIQNRVKAINGGVVDLQFQKKAVELRFRQRIRSFHFERVLRC